MFGGKGERSLEKIDLRKKASEEIAEYKSELVGGSMIEIKNILYVFGGSSRQGQPNQSIILFDLSKKKFLDDRLPLNYE